MTTIAETNADWHRYLQSRCRHQLRQRPEDRQLPGRIYCLEKPGHDGPHENGSLAWNAESERVR